MSNEDNQKNPISGRNRINRLPEAWRIRKTTCFTPEIKRNVRQINTYATILGLILDPRVSQNPENYQNNGGEK
jgi:hypothetical protein